MQQVSSPSAEGRPAERVPEARYAYYRRCQVFRRNGEQCKAPAEKGEAICHAHATQRATAFRRDLERRIVLAEAVAEMRRRGKPEYEMADLFMDFKDIQITLAVVSRALITGRIDCKTAGRLLVHLQTMSKLLWMPQGKRTSTAEARRHGEQPKIQKKAELPLICAEERRSNREQEFPVLWMLQKGKSSPLINTDNTDLEERQKSIMVEERRLCAVQGEEPRVAVDGTIQEFPEEPRTVQHGKWEQTGAA